MENFKILIVEDEELYADKLEMLIDKLGYEHVGTVDNSTDALGLIDKNPPDLIIMDVHIQGEYDGIELTDLVHQRQMIPIVFITSMLDDLTFKRASRTNPIQFMTKPFNDIQLQRTIELSIQQLDTSKPAVEKNDNKIWTEDILLDQHIYIKNRQKLEKVALMNILYLEADGHYCQVHTMDKKYLVRLSLNDLSKRLPTELFFQTHRSFLVNMKKIQSVDLQDSIVLLPKGHVPLSKRNREVLLKKLDWI